MSWTDKKGRTISSTLLVVGTAIGSAMFGVPIFTGLGGYLPMIAMTTIVWLCMTATGYLFAEAVLGMPEGTNVISMTHHYFGKWGKYLIGIPYFVFSFIVLISFPASSIPLLTNYLEGVFHIQIPPLISFTFSGAFFCLVIFLGVPASVKTNAAFLIAFFILFFAICVRGFPFFQTTHLLPMNWTFMFLSAPILFMALCFHYLVPTLVTYLKRDVELLRRTIFAGLFISYIIYVLWQTLIIGAVTEGTLWGAFEKGDIIQQGLEILAKTPWLGAPAIFLATCAFATGLIGLAISLVDMLGDWAKWPAEKRVGWRRLGVCLFLFVPTIVVSALYPDPIFAFLDKVGGFAFIILNGILPIAMAWRARYNMPQTVPRLLLGEKPLLILLFLIVSYILYIQGIVLSH